jgi:hypothetical protein
MDLQLAGLCALTFIIHLIGTLAYAARIAGVRTRQIAVSFALFNVLVLISRTSNSFQGPFLAKRLEATLIDGVTNQLLSDFRWLMISATVATIIGVIAVPTFQRIFSGAVRHFRTTRSVPKLLLHAFAKGGLSYLKSSVTIPSSVHIKDIRVPQGLSPAVIASNVVAQALMTIAVFASLYAGVLTPEFRVTASTLSSIINGVATLVLFLFIDPYLSVMTDDVVEGRVSEAFFRRAVIWLAGARIAGTFLAQLIFVPAAHVISMVAGRI